MQAKDIYWFAGYALDMTRLHLTTRVPELILLMLLTGDNYDARQAVPSIE